MAKFFKASVTPSFFNGHPKAKFQHSLKITVTKVEPGNVVGEMPVTETLFAPNGFIHAGSLVTLADTMAGNATVAHLPDGAFAFTTLELKCNFIGAVKEGTLQAIATPIHIGRRTQVWKVDVREKASQKPAASFSCTQLILYPKE